MPALPGPARSRARTLVLAVALVVASLAAAAPRPQSVAAQAPLAPSVLKDGRAVFATTDPRVGFQWIARESSAQTLRVICFGGAETAGLSFAPHVTVPHYLKQMLTQAAPARTVEVVNLGVAGLSARPMRLLVEVVCERFAPDLLVVSVGGEAAGAARRGEQHAAQAGALDGFEAQLRAMARAAERARVPLLLCTVAPDAEWRAGHAERVRRVAASTSAYLFDTGAVLQVGFPPGPAGMGAFFDQVHYSPAGALRVAAGVVARIGELGVAPEVAGFDAEAFVARTLNRLDGLEGEPRAEGRGARARLGDRAQITAGPWSAHRPAAPVNASFAEHEDCAGPEPADPRELEVPEQPQAHVNPNTLQAARRP